MRQHGPTSGPRPQWGPRLVLNSALVRSRIRIISTVKCYFRLDSPKNWEFRTMCQLATCDDRRPKTGQGLFHTPSLLMQSKGDSRSRWFERFCQVIYSQFGLAIHQNDHQARRRFAEWAQNEIAVVPDFYKRILFSDEALFWLNGYVNKQNCRIRSEANPQELWFQQDGATCHTARATIDLLKDTLGDRLISRFGPANWPPRSCDLTPLDYFLWGYVKSLVYADKPQTLDHLEDNLRRVIADIRPQMLEKVIENWTSRLDYIRASRGSYMPEIIFKM
ncbi:DUF4817 domain-containing protein [Trichonephila clavipes]|nr:DUF4817 domain-containing protein [Trichonephila clavipes]